MFCGEKSGARRHLSPVPQRPRLLSAPKYVVQALVGTMTTTSARPSIVIDPQNVANILLHKKTDACILKEPYVSSAVKVSSDGVAHGRGLVATRTIAAGELLFATPPTIEAPLQQVYEKWQTQRRNHSIDSTTENDGEYRCLEACAEEGLLDAMQQACTEQPAIAASFAALVGSPDEVNHNNNNNLPTIAVLLGQDENAGQSLPEMTRDDMRQIIRANAFGPDGLHSYQNIEEQWIQAQCNDDDRNDENVALLLQRTTPRLLGLYPLADMVNHACLANAVRVYAAGNIMLVHALTEIAAGTEIVYSYVPPSQTVQRRRSVLEQQHGFVCTCIRCLTEERVEPVLSTSSQAASLLESLQAWNYPRLADFPSYTQLHKAVKALEDVVLPLPDLTNETRRFLRIAYLHVYIHYFNVSLAKVQAESDDFVAGILRKDLLTLATQLHFSFCACHNASTEHLSVRLFCCGKDLCQNHFCRCCCCCQLSRSHEIRSFVAIVVGPCFWSCLQVLQLCYELAARDAQAKVRFWTEQLKRAHMLRYGSLGNDINHVRRVMQHSRTVLRQTHGWNAVEYSFL